MTVVTHGTVVKFTESGVFFYLVEEHYERKEKHYE